MIRALCFDLFDTLVDLSFARLPRMELGGREIPTTAGYLYELLAGPSVDLTRFAETLYAVDREQRETRYRAGVEVSTLERFQLLVERLGLREEGIAARLSDRHMELLREQVEVPRHHGEVLSALAARLPLYLCSNFTDTASAHRVLEEAGFADFFTHVVVSESVGFRKPRREIFEAVLHASGLAPGQVLHVGDNLEADVGGASASGMRTAWITRRVEDLERARASGRAAPPDFEIADLGELPGLLDRVGVPR